MNSLQVFGSTPRTGKWPIVRLCLHKT